MPADFRNATVFEAEFRALPPARLGAGGGAGRGGARGALPRAAATRATEKVVEVAWLARHQSPEGRWGPATFSLRCGRPVCGGTGYEENEAGLTGLALLAFLGAGYTPASREAYVDVHTGRRVVIGEVVKRGLVWLVSQQHEDGRIGDRGTHETYNHSIAALALSEAYGLGGGGALKESAQRAPGYVILPQHPYSGWRYTKQCQDNDTSNTGLASRR